MLNTKVVLAIDESVTDDEGKAPNVLKGNKGLPQVTQSCQSNDRLIDGVEVDHGFWIVEVLIILRRMLWTC